MFHYLKELSQLFVKHGHLMTMLTTQQFKARYRGSFLGMFWALLNPLLLLGVYGFVFSYLFPPRWNNTTGQDIPFAILLFAGIMIHQYLAECLMRAPTIILDQANYVKKVVFPLEVLLPASLGSYLFIFLIQWLLLLVATLLVTHSFYWIGLIWLPFVLLPFLMMMTGIGWILAAIGVYIRDLSHFMSLLIMVLLFLSPVLYPIDVFPEFAKPLVYLNPQSFPIESLRQLMILGQSPDWNQIIVYAAVSVATYVIGYIFFKSLKTGFADVI